MRKKIHTVGTVPLEISLKEGKSIHLTHKYMYVHFPTLVQASQLEVTGLY